MSSALPEDVHRFILSRIESVEQLEVLLLMHRTPTTGWTPEAVARELYSTPSSVRGRLDSLVRQELVASSGSPPSFRYEPQAPGAGRHGGPDGRILPASAGGGDHPDRVQAAGECPGVLRWRSGFWAYSVVHS
jgi:hypothetical protein